MLARLVRGRRVHSLRLAKVMARVPRHHFAPNAPLDEVYGADAVEVLEGQTLTCPEFVAQMTQLLRVRKGDRVLDVGSGTGYQAAILAKLGCQVVSIEVRPALHALARRNLQRAGIDSVELRLGDGALGAPERGPFRGIIAACASETLPPALLDQLAVGGRLVCPVGAEDRVQTLVVATRHPHGVDIERVRGAWFVPMV